MSLERRRVVGWSECVPASLHRPDSPDQAIPMRFTGTGGIRDAVRRSAAEPNEGEHAPHVVQQQHVDAAGRYT
jgi:hypothetical protein